MGFIIKKWSLAPRILSVSLMLAVSLTGQAADNPAPALLDVDNNGIVDVADITAVLFYLTQTPDDSDETTQNAIKNLLEKGILDVDGDNNIGAFSDILAIYLYLIEADDILTGVLTNNKTDLQVATYIEGITTASEIITPNLSAAAFTYTVGATINTIISPSATGFLHHCSISPSLPAGINISLSADGNSCLLSGGASAIQSTTNYTLTATNAIGFAATTITIIIINNNPPIAINAVLNINLLAQDKTTQTSTLIATDVDDDTLTYLITQQATSGTAIITNAATGAYYYQTHSGITEAGSDFFQFSVNDGMDTDIGAVTVHLRTDPLYKHQWYLDNTGQSNFASNGGIAGEDINANDAINDGKTGLGIIVAVADEGLEIAHEDLVDNVVVGGSYNFVDDSTDTTNPSANGDHGTSVAGIIASTGWNNIGGRGVAPFASLKGFNFLQVQTLESELNSLGAGNYAKDVDIFNQSFGTDNLSDYEITPELEAQYLDGVSNGAVYVKSAGNGFYSLGLLQSVSAMRCGAAIEQGLSCQNANMDATNTLPYNIIVAALDANGKKSSYSTAGASIWLSAPGGDLWPNTSIFSTDQSGCEQGYTQGSSVYGADDPNCNYTNNFSGTSAAAPIVSGVIALMLETNPNLTWRDVKHILASTADQVDAQIPTTILVNTQKTPTIITYDAEPPWLVNAAGYKFHNYYGFGRINAGAAVAMAKDWNSDNFTNFATPEWQQSSPINTAIPDLNTAGLTHTITNNNTLTIEAVQIRVNVQHTFTGELSIELTSPSATRSVLMNAYNGFYWTQDLDNMVLLSNAFYGENATGDWTLKIVDLGNGDFGELQNWAIRIFGY